MIRSWQVKKSQFTTALLLLLATGTWAKNIQLLNVSYDPTREFYQQYNQEFSDYWQKKTGIPSLFASLMVAQVSKLYQW